MPSRDFISEDLFSSPMISMHSPTHSSQINTVGPAMSLRSSCWLLPQNVQRSGFLVSPPLTLLISDPGQDTRAPRTMPVSTRDWLSVQMMAVFKRDFPPGWLPFVHSTPLS